MTNNNNELPARFRILKEGLGRARRTPLHEDEASDYRAGITWAKWETGHAVIGKTDGRAWLALTPDVSLDVAALIAGQWRKSASVEEWRTEDGDLVAYTVTPARKAGK